LTKIEATEVIVWPSSNFWYLVAGSLFMQLVLLFGRGFTINRIVLVKWGKSIIEVSFRYFFIMEVNCIIMVWYIYTVPCKQLV